MLRLSILSALVLSLLMPINGQTRPLEPQVVQDTSTSATDAIAECLKDSQSQNENQERCIGITVQACSQVAVSTVDILGCLQPEIDAWDTRLQSTYAQLVLVYSEQDAHEDPIRALAPRLEVVQEQWRVWRGAKCGFAYDMFRGGSLGRITAANCQLEETALRTLELDVLLAEAQ